jgi:transcriptional regulator with XRE-family HTH domain
MSPRQLPKYLGQKLRAIRESNGWSLDQMADAVGKTSSSRRTRVYEWEQGKRQPDLASLLAYAKLASVTVEVLIDDGLELSLK